MSHSSHRHVRLWPPHYCKKQTKLHIVSFPSLIVFFVPQELRVLYNLFDFAMNLSQCWALASRFALMRHRVIDAKAKTDAWRGVGNFFLNDSFSHKRTMIFECNFRRFYVVDISTWYLRSRLALGIFVPHHISPLPSLFSPLSLLPPPPYPLPSTPSECIFVWNRLNLKFKKIFFDCFWGNNHDRRRFIPEINFLKKMMFSQN